MLGATHGVGFLLGFGESCLHDQIAEAVGIVREVRLQEGFHHEMTSQTF